MAVLLITYDLNAKGQKHNEVLTKIKDFQFWLQLSESSYAVSTSLSADQVFKNFENLIDNNDRMFVVPMMQPYQGWASKEQHKWLGEHLEYA